MACSPPLLKWSITDIVTVMHNPPTHQKVEEVNEVVQHDVTIIMAKEEPDLQGLSCGVPVR